MAWKEMRVLMVHLDLLWVQFSAFVTSVFIFFWCFYLTFLLLLWWYPRVLLVSVVLLAQLVLQVFQDALDLKDLRALLEKKEDRWVSRISDTQVADKKTDVLFLINTTGRERTSRPSWKRWHSGTCGSARTRRTSRTTRRRRRQGEYPFTRVLRNETSQVKSEPEILPSSSNTHWGESVWWCSHQPTNFKKGKASSSQLPVPRCRQSGKMEEFFGCDRRCESDPLIFRGKNNSYPREKHFAAEIVEG